MTPTVAPISRVNVNTRRCPSSAKLLHKWSSKNAATARCGFQPSSISAPANMPNISGITTRRVAMASRIATTGGSRLNGP